MTKIRAAIRADSQSMVDIYNHYVSHTTATFEENGLSVSDFEDRVKAVLASGLPWFVCESDEGVQGYAYARPWNSRSAYRYTAEVSIYVSPIASSKGMGSQLYTALFNELRLRDIQQIIAVITLPNDRSIALHEKLGMRKAAHLSQVGFKFERWLDVGYWQGSLT